MSGFSQLRHWAGARLPGAAARRVQIALYAEEWVADNAAALAADGPLWVALGDSTGQAIGAATRDGGYVLRLLRRLREVSDPAWRVVNLSVSGARVADVVEGQLPALAELVDASLVTCAVGGNDLLRTSPADTEAALRRLAASLPAGAVLANLPRGIREHRAARLNAVVADVAARHGLVVADLWSRTGPPWAGRFSADHFHPNDVGYAAWADAFAEALEL